MFSSISLYNITIINVIFFICYAKPTIKVAKIRIILHR